MPTTVELAADAPPVFPDRCVVSNGEGPDDSVRLLTLCKGHPPLAPGFAELRRATVPVYSACKPKLVRPAWQSKLLRVAAALGFYTPPLEVHAHEGRVRFVFRERSYAEQFAELSEGELLPS